MDTLRTILLRACCGVFYVVCLVGFVHSWYRAWFDAIQFQKIRLAVLDAQDISVRFGRLFIPRGGAVDIWLARLGFSFSLIVWLLIGIGAIYFWYISTH